MSNYNFKNVNHPIQNEITNIVEYNTIPRIPQRPNCSHPNGDHHLPHFTSSQAIWELKGHRNFVAKLLNMMQEADVEKGSTALCFAAAAGHVHIAKLMVAKNENLPKIKGESILSTSPLYMAALHGFNQMAIYLYPLSDFQSWATTDQTTLLTTLIDSELYGKIFFLFFILTYDWGKDRRLTL